ncbi:MULTISPECIES: type 1 fimbrial protein [Pantoea]|uniref:type 1 fimbrial protein n=1 Tax=Pantoea TaxID=53335 RepID=UPI001F3520EC|nr:MULTISPECIES: type 1 fimbrial protein [Pantoea]UIL54444.1 type 1 fimbrial protein [Pantoea agglomerans]
MKLSLNACLATLLFTLFGQSASAESLSSSGTISFSGAIVNGSCDMNVMQNPAALQCTDPMTGKMVVSTLDMTKSQKMGQLPFTVETKWLDAAKRQGMVTVTYL